MISKLFVNKNYNTVVKQELAEHPPYHILDPSLDQLSICAKYTTVKTHAQGGLLITAVNKHSKLSLKTFIYLKKEW